MKSSIAFILSILAFGIDANAADLGIPGNEGHGGDVFDLSPIGEGYRFFDMIEFGESFDPLNVAGAQEFANQMSRMKEKFPALEKAFELVIRSAHFSFVNPELNDIAPKGNSNLKGYKVDEKGLLQTWLTYEKKQAAIATPENLTVQVNRKIWDSLPSDEARSFLLMHECLWLAYGGPALFNYLNPRIQFHSAQKVSDSDLYDMKVGQVSVGSQGGVESNYFINSKDIDLDSSIIRRVTAKLMDPNTFGNNFDAQALSVFISQNSPRVHEKTRVENIFWVSSTYRYTFSFANPNSIILTSGWVLESTETISSAINTAGGMGIIVSSGLVRDPVSEDMGSKSAIPLYKTKLTTSSPLALIIERESQSLLSREAGQKRKANEKSEIAEATTALKAALDKLTSETGALRGSSTWNSEVETGDEFHYHDSRSNFMDLRSQIVVYRLNKARGRIENVHVGRGFYSHELKVWSIEISKSSDYVSVDWPQIDQIYLGELTTGSKREYVATFRYFTGTDEFVKEKQLKFSGSPDFVVMPK